jgi:D-serine deaminase-like pyridoxal phosphate-dependent protein
LTRVQDLDTPALVIDLDIMERNLQRVADYAASHKLRLRPHTKTHKSLLIAQKQLALGAAGLTVAKTTEAEVMLGAGAGELLVAFPVIGEAKARRLASIAGILGKSADGTPRVTIAIDSVFGAKQLSQAAEVAGVRFGILVEIDVGLGRAGVAPSEAGAFTSAVAALPHLDCLGFTFYPGHIKDQSEQKIAELSETVARVREELVRAGYPPKVVSGGSTPLLYRSHEVEGLNEIRPGTYVFNDLNTVAGGACNLEDCAASVLVTVASHTHPERMIVDGGSKTFSSDKLSSGGPGHGRLLEAPGAVFHKMNEEHGFIDLSAAERDFTVGDKVRIIPNHICVAVNLHEYVYGVRDGVVEEVWNVEARGKLQ